MAVLLVKALGPDRVIGVMMPQGEQKDICDSLEVCKCLGIKNYTVNIGPVCHDLFEDFVNHTNLPLTTQIETNAPSRIRMNVLYMVAAAVGGRVCNTGNASEAFIGYTTKYGDLAGDFALLKNLTVFRSRFLATRPRTFVSTMRRKRNWHSDAIRSLARGISSYMTSTTSSPVAIR